MATQIIFICLALLMGTGGYAFYELYSCFKLCKKQGIIANEGLFFIVTPACKERIEALDQEKTKWVIKRAIERAKLWLAIDLLMPLVVVALVVRWGAQ